MPFGIANHGILHWNLNYMAIKLSYDILRAPTKAMECVPISLVDYFLFLSQLGNTLVHMQALW